MGFEGWFKRELHVLWFKIGLYYVLPMIRVNLDVVNVVCMVLEGLDLMHDGITASVDSYNRCSGCATPWFKSFLSTSRQL